MRPTSRLLLTLVVAVAVAVGALALRRSRASPGYPLRRIVAGASRGDPALVERYMDVDAVARAVADERVAARARDVGAPATRATVDSIRAAADAEGRLIAAGLRTLVASGGAPATPEAAATAILVERARLRRARLGTIRVRDQDASQATLEVAVEYPYLDTAITVEATVSRQGGDWRLTGLRGIDALSREARNAEARRLEEINRPVDVALSPLLRLEDPSFAVDTVSNALPAWLESSVQVWNVGRQPITALRLRIAPARNPYAGLFVDLPAGDTLHPGSTVRLTGRLSGEDVRSYLPLFRGREELRVTATRAIVGRGVAARRYRAVERWDDPH